MTRLLITVLALLCLVTAPVLGQELRIATGDYPPFIDANAADGGIVNQTVAEMAEKAGYSPSFEYMPWMRALELARAGRYHATSAWYFSEKRRKDFIHVGPVVEDRLVFFRRKSTALERWENLADLSPYKIGAVTGYTITAEFWQLADDGVLSVQLAPSDEANFRKLLAGRIDLYPVSEETGWHLVDRIFGPDDRALLDIVEMPLAVTHMYLLVSRAANDADSIAASLQAALDGTKEPTDVSILSGID